MFLLTATSSTASGTATETITSLHLILIAVLIVLVIAAILWGVRQKSARAAGERQEAERTDALLAHPQTATAVSPAPPPLGDSGMGAGAALQPEVAKPAKPAPNPKPAPAPKPAAKAAPAVDTPAPKAVAPKPAAKPKAAVPAPAPSAYRLIDVKGLGPKAVPLLEAQGVVDLATLAALDPTRAAAIDAGLGALSGRLTRDKWIEQAKLLAAGNVAEFEATYGKL